MHHNVVCCRPVLMGAQLGTYAQELVKPGKIPAVPAIGDADQPLHVLRRRPDIIDAERRLAASNERIGMAISDYYPKISLSGALGFDSINGGTLFNGKAFQLSVRVHCDGACLISAR
jgi:outer membrane protein TolC